MPPETSNAQPIIVGDQVITTAELYQLISVDLATGKILWSAKEKNVQFFSSPAVTADSVLIGARDKNLHCYDRATGQLKWNSGDITLAQVWSST